jgi:CheY-like chemotaxis protein
MASPEKRRGRDTRVSNSPGRALILVVEDQEDVRRLLTTALEIEGHDVDEAADAREGLKCLENGHYDLVLSDYAMPGETGAWMLREAERLGLLAHTAALIVTAYPDARDLWNREVILKPLDLDLFLDQVRRTLGEPGHRDEPARYRRGYRVELVLYVSPASTPSVQARRNLETLFERFDSTQIKLTVCDLGRDPCGGDNDRVAFTPTLVKRYPAPRMWVLGNLRDTEIVADLLRTCGVDART